MQRTPLSDEERTLREQYIEQKCKLFKEAEELKHTILHARLDCEHANVRLRDIEQELWDNFQQLVDANEKIRSLQEPASQEPDEKAKDLFGWHPASEKPERTEGWFLAITKDNLPFLTHYLNGWLPQVCQWQYISLPM